MKSQKEHSVFRVSGPVAATRLTGGSVRRLVRFRQIVFILHILYFILLNASLANPIPVNRPLYFPAWWFDRSVIVPINPNDANPVWPASYPPSNDFGGINIGQLKQIATQAAAELNARLPGGAGPEINALIQSWQQPPAPGVQRDDFLIPNIGQAKNIAKLFYDRLIAVGYAHAYPWSNSLTPPNDFSIINIGQAKNLFKFDVADDDGDGMPNGWEVSNGFDPANGDENGNGILDSLDDADGDGVSNLDEQLQGRNPHAGALPDANGQLNLQVYSPLE